MLSRKKLSTQIGHGTSGSISISDFQGDLIKIKIQLRIFKVSQICNLDKSSLFYQLLLNKTIGSSNFKEFKQPKNRISLAICYSALDDNIITPVITTQSKNPPCVKGVNKEEYFNHFSNPKPG